MRFRAEVAGVGSCRVFGRGFDWPAELLNGLAVEHRTLLLLRFEERATDWEYSVGWSFLCGTALDLASLLPLVK